MSFAIVFGAAFFNVFCLALNSKLLRDDKIFTSFLVSWLITLAQFGTMWSVANAALQPHAYILVAGLGGSIGIVLSQYFYHWYDRRYHND